MPQPPMPQLGNGFIQPPQRHMQPSPQPPHLREDDDNQSGRGSALGSVYGSEHGENARVSLEIGGAAGDGERNAAPSTQNTADSKHMERPGTPDSVRSASTGTSKSNRYAPSTGGDSERLSIASDANAISDRRSTDGSSAGGLVGIPAPTPVPAGPIPPTHPLGRPAGHFPLGPQPPMVTVPASGDMPVQAIPPPMPPMGYPAMMHPAAGHGHPMNGTMMGHGTMMGTMGAGTMGYGARWPAEASFMAAPGGPGAYAASSNGSSVYGGSVRYDSDNVSIRSNTTGATGMTSGTVNSITPSMRAAWGSFGESLEVARQNAKRSNDPATLLDFAKYLIAVAEDVPSSEPDPKKAKRKQDVLFAEALKIIKKLASSSGMGKSAFPEAQFFLAECYGNGSIGLSVDHDRAFNLYVQASKQSHPASTFRTAYCYEVGAGTKRDSARALQYYRKAAALGDTAGMYKLGMILFNGLLGQAKNPREGITWLKRAAQQADEHTPHALHELGLLYEGKGSDVAGNVIIVDPSYAHDLFLRAAQLGFAPSQYKLGLCYEYGLLGLPIDPRRSIAWYTRAAEERDPEAELALSGWYLTGAEGVLKQSDQEAYLWARKAADKGLAKAEYAVGYYSEHGVGVRPDPEEARRWYLRAAGQGNKRAIQRVREMREVGAPKGAVRKGDWRKDQSAKDGECLVM
ncbi:hypothetical protein HK104_006726 [Borealophlyctis nickersoniae]|nr:hypothetical protein HK104_006726 [Borealophlyctis nickersoniae]